MLVFEQKHPDISDSRSFFLATFECFPQNGNFWVIHPVRWHLLGNSEGAICHGELLKNWDFQENLQKLLEKENGSRIYQGDFAQKRAFCHNSQIERVRAIFQFRENLFFSGGIPHEKNENFPVYVQI